MRFSVSYVPDGTSPESQHELRQIPPSQRVNHKEIQAAIVAYETAKADELTKRRDAIDAEQQLPEAEDADALALADAQMAGKADPGAKHRQKQLAAIADCRRKHAASKIVLARCVDAVAAVFGEHGDAWLEQLEHARDELLAQMATRLDEWQALWIQLQANAANRAVVTGAGHLSPSMFAKSFNAPPAQDGDVIEVAYVLEGLRGLAAPQAPRENVVENLEPGSEPTRHWQDRDKRIREWQEQDEARAREEGASVAAYGIGRDERLDRAAARRAERESQREAEKEAIEVVR